MIARLRTGFSPRSSQTIRHDGSLLFYPGPTSPSQCDDLLRPRRWLLLQPVTPGQRVIQNLLVILDVFLDYSRLCELDDKNSIVMLTATGVGGAWY